MEELEFKFSVDWTKSAFYCGLDVHKYEIAVALYSQDDSCSDFLKTSTFSTDSKGLQQMWSFVKKYRPMAFAMEATGIYHHIPFKFLYEKRSQVHWPFKIFIVNPADAAGLPGRQKADKIDAEHLAKYLAKGLLEPGQPIIEVLEDLKQIFRTAMRMEKERTALKNRIKKTLDRAGIRPKKFNLNHQWVLEFLFHFIGQEESIGSCVKKIIEDLSVLPTHRNKIQKHINLLIPYFEFTLTAPQRALIRQDLVELDFITARKTLLAVEIDNTILERPGLREQAHNLASIPGISPFTALWILTEIGTVKRFSDRNKFLAYCGCCPRIVSSAGKVYSAHISRHSNKYLRTIFYNAAVVLCNLTKRDSVLKTYASKIMQRKRMISTKLVYCVVANKIARIAYGLLMTHKPFNPNYGRTLEPYKISSRTMQFSVSDRKALRRARNSLKRVSIIESIGVLGDYSKNLAQHLELALQGKKFSD
jgi:transposase